MGEIPKEIRDVYNLLDTEIQRLHYEWQLYQEVFDQSKDRVELLTRFGPRFFDVCQEAILNDVVISLSRLVDPPKSDKNVKQKEKLSLKRFLESVDPNLYPELRENMQQCWKRLTNAVSLFEL